MSKQFKLKTETRIGDIFPLFLHKIDGLPALDVALRGIQREHFSTIPEILFSALVDFFRAFSRQI